MSPEAGPPPFLALPVRFTLAAEEPLFLPETKETNVFRGALGLALRDRCHRACADPKTCVRTPACAYRRLFDPRLDAGPSGYRDAPRPMVLRWNGRGGHIAPGQSFDLDAVLFDPTPDAFDALHDAIERAAAKGLGPARARVRIAAIDRQAPQQLPLEGPDGDATIRVTFATPCEIKEHGVVKGRPGFSSLLQSLAGRIWALGRFYQGWPPEWDIRRLLDRAHAARPTHSALHYVDIERRSSKTGQHHGIGGFVGTVDYTGPVLACLPLLRIGRWTGAGRHTVWGKGVIEVQILEGPP